MTIFDHPLEQAFVVAVVTWFVKSAVDFFIKKDFIKNYCRDRQALCKQEMTNKLKEGDTEFDGIGTDLDEIKKTLAIMVEMQLAICNHDKLDCSEFVKRLINEGLIKK